jgi:hypothetical protein
VALVSRYDKRDANEPEIVRGLRAAGRSVELLPGGNGRPDLLVGWGRSHVLLMEVKTEDGDLESNQVDWHRRWRGLPVVVVRTVAEALRATGVPVR